jgi:hypothetical protein
MLTALSGKLLADEERDVAKRGQHEQAALLLANRGGGVGVVAALQNAGGLTGVFTPANLGFDNTAGGRMLAPLPRSELSIAAPSKVSPRIVRLDVVTMIPLLSSGVPTATRIS